MGNEIVIWYRVIEVISSLIQCLMKDRENFTVLESDSFDMYYNI